MSNIYIEMENDFFISFGIPKHGWLPVTFRYKDFSLDFDASDVLNDPIEEVFLLTISNQPSERRTVTWWLEPVAYIFNFEINMQTITLNIIEKDDLHKDSSNEKTLITISGNKHEIINHFRAALKEFAKQKFEEEHWSFSLSKEKINML